MLSTTNFEALLESLDKTKLVCPYCGAIQEDTCELEEGTGTDFCGECEKEFSFTKEIVIEFSSAKLEDQ